jgi:hypothetical protein
MGELEETGRNWSNLSIPSQKSNTIINKITIYYKNQFNLEPNYSVQISNK